MTGQCAATFDCDRTPDGTGVCWFHSIDQGLAGRPGPDDHRLSTADVKYGLTHPGVGLSWPRLWDT